VKKVLLAAVLGVAGAGHLALAQVGPGEPLSVLLRNDIVTSYDFRGYNREQNGFIDQPSAALFWKAYRSENLTATPFVGTWNSLHSEQRGRPGGAPGGVWFESDAFAGVDLAFNHFVMTPTYTLYTYPQSDFNTVQEFGLRVKYDDRYLVKEGKLPFAIQPFVGYYTEFNGSNANTNDEGIYAEVGIQPEFQIPKTEIDVSFPMKLGMSLDGYYRDANGHNTTFGYALFGVEFAIPLPVDKKYGDWRLIAGVDYTQLLANSTRASYGGDNDNWTGRVGISVLY
jgi:hypothetical protein